MSLLSIVMRAAKPATKQVFPDIHPVDDNFQEALDYWKYGFVDKSSHDNDEVARSVPKWIVEVQVQAKSLLFDFLDHIPIISFLSALELACDMDGVQNGSAWCLLHKFLKPLVATTLNICIAPRSKWHSSQMEGTATFYCEAVKYVLQKYAADDVVAKMGANRMVFM